MLWPSWPCFSPDVVLSGLDGTLFLTTALSGEDGHSSAIARKQEGYAIAWPARVQSTSVLRPLTVSGGAQASWHISPSRHCPHSIHSSSLGVVLPLLPPRRTILPLALLLSRRLPGRSSPLARACIATKVGFRPENDSKLLSSLLDRQV